MGTARRLGSQVTSNAPLVNFRKLLAPLLPLLPDRRPQSAPEPRINGFQYRGRQAEAKVASPSPQVVSLAVRLPQALVGDFPSY